MPRGKLHRRGLLVGTAALLIGGTDKGFALTGRRPWFPYTPDAPDPVQPGPWVFFTPEEGTTVDALVDRLIPHDELSVSGKEAGCGIFIDRQLAGDYGSSARLYMRPPYMHGNAFQGPQTPQTPAGMYRSSLAALNAWCGKTYLGKMPADLSPGQRDAMLKGLEGGSIKLEHADGRAFFDQLLGNTMEGFFADPIYGGNQNFAGWTMIGFPGARYDYRDYIGRQNQRLDIQPVGLAGRPAWTEKAG